MWDDDYTGTPTRLRIVYEVQGDEYPWLLDGIDRRTGLYSEDCERHRTQADAFAAAEDFVKRNVGYGLTWEWNATEETQR